MSNRYQTEHYEDVAKILSKDARTVEIVTEDIARDFANLFAADNPQRCTAHVACPYNHSDGRDNDCHIYGFNRAQFLTACGLKKEG